MNRLNTFYIFGAAFLLSFCSSYTMTKEAKKVVANLANAPSGYEKIELMQDTPFQTPAFIFDSGEPGDAVLIIGGTHGNEPAGYEAALRLFKQFQSTPPKKGKIVLIPLANKVSIDNYDRRIFVPEGEDIERGNLNRCYPGKEDGLPMEQMAWHIQNLAIENDVKIFIDMHEARYLHLDTPPGSWRDQGLGQTVIFHPNEASSWLMMNMLDGINATITHPDERFSSVEEPILHSAAWWAGTQLDVASFTFETARIFDLDKRIGFHLALVRIALEVSGMW